MTDLVKVNQPLTMVYDLKLLNETDDEQKLNQFLGELISFTLLNPRLTNIGLELTWLDSTQLTVL